MQPVARSKQFTWAVLGRKCGSRNGVSWVAREPARWQGSDSSLTLERGQIGLAHTLNVECEGRALVTGVCLSNTKLQFSIRLTSRRAAVMDGIHS